MKLVKMSLAAAVLLGASAFAIDNVKVSGDAKLFYGTSNTDQTTAGTSDALFGYDNSYADTALRIGATGDLTKGVSFGVTATAVSTLGLENNLVANTWTGAHYHSGAVDDEAWVSEAWIAATLGKTTAKIGRMELDTPLAFSEKWSVAANTFEGAVLLNQDLPDTTLVGAWVGKANGVNVLGANSLGGVTDNRQDIVPGGATNPLGIDGIMATGAKMTTFVKGGAYAAALVNNSYKPLTFQAWYYNVVDVADAYWLQADINCQLVKGLTIGAQYADIDTKGVAKTFTDSSAYAFKLGYSKDKLNVAAAYSNADKDGTLKIANVATNNLGNSQSKLYTEAFWNYGYVGRAGAESYMLLAEYDAGIAKFAAQYTDVTVRPTSAASNEDMTEVALTATKSFGPLDATLAYISTDATDQNTAVNANGARYDSVQAYLTLKF
ncbi:MAG: hypothetical protein CJD30_02890 [Sulfuricurvum sp. PD_MW2]|uniref:porin n=1 Tax=Sulfuricurvum sp. PD_MW2 TaxID=2027917 RepID=UPI000C061FAF|nr:porin [Sulfuricurvum sp. PD_MW2]PHM18142.1 MAG: hypothetical protein CJD30_02890 [Sulfuricurvum sp. PD_MW2]